MRTGVYILLLPGIKHLPRLKTVGPANGNYLIRNLLLKIGDEREAAQQKVQYPLQSTISGEAYEVLSS